MANNVESYLSQHFEKNEIKELEKRPDFETTKKRLEQLQADNMMDSLASRTEKWVISKSGSLEERFENFKIQISQSNQEIIKTESPINPEKYISEQKEKLETQFLEKLAGGKKPDITNPDNIKWVLGIWAYQQIESQSNLETENVWINNFIASIKAQIWMFIMSFLWKGDDYQTYLDAKNNIQIPEIKNKPRSVENNETNERFKYQGIVNVFANIFDRGRWDKKAEYMNVLYNGEFANFTINELIDMKSKNFKNDAFINFCEKYKFNKDDAKEAIRLLTSWESAKLIENVYSKTEDKDNYKNFKVWEIFNRMSQDMDLLSGKWVQNIVFKISKGEIISENDIPKETNELLEKKGLSLNILSLAQSKHSFKFEHEKKDALIAQINWTEDFDKKYSSQEKEKVEDLVDFGYNIQENLFVKNDYFEIFENESNPNMSLKDIFSESPLSLREVVELKLITWDKSHFEDLNDVQQSALYLRVYGYISSRGYNKESWAYMISMLELATESGTEKSNEMYGRVPEWVKTILKRTITTWVNKAGNSLEVIVEKIQWAFNESTGKGLSAIAFFAPIFTERQALSDIAGITE